MIYDANEEEDMYECVSSVISAFNICNNVVLTMKPTFKMLCNAINEIKNKNETSNYILKKWFGQR